jgi:hypothetical protein
MNFRRAIRAGLSPASFVQLPCHPRLSVVVKRFASGQCNSQPLDARFSRL